MTTIFNISETLNFKQNNFLGYCQKWLSISICGSIKNTGNGTGPSGKGPMSGRDRGYSNMYYTTGLAGWARYNAYLPQAMTASQEAEPVKNQAKLMQDDLDVLNKRIQELEKLETEK
jgi:hypothetical protein